MQDQLMELQKKQFGDFESKYNQTLDEIVRIKTIMEEDEYEGMAKTNQRVSKANNKLEQLIRDVNKLNIEQRGEISRIENDIQNRIVTVEKLVGNELKQNY